MRAVHFVLATNQELLGLFQWIVQHDIRTEPQAYACDVLHLGLCIYLLREAEVDSHLAHVCNHHNLLWQQEHATATRP